MAGDGWESYLYPLTPEQKILVTGGLPVPRCLVNKENIRDPAELAKFERTVSGLRDLHLARNPMPGNLDAEHLSRMHKFLFGDVYPWAGELRTCTMFKGASSFARPDGLRDRTRVLFGALKEDKYLRGLDAPTFCKEVGGYLAELNEIHPFREGNGRAQRAFFRTVAYAAGYEMDFDRVPNQREWAEASVWGMSNRMDDSKPLAGLVARSLVNIEPREDLQEDWQARAEQQQDVGR